MGTTQKKKPDPLMTAFDDWKKHPSEASLSALLVKAKPTISSAVQSFGGGDTRRVGAQAKLLAIKAFGNYDPSRKTKLTTYLMHQLRPLSRINRTRSFAIRLPERVVFDRRNMEDTAATFEGQNNRPPSDDELADLTGLSTKRISYIRGLRRGELPESSYRTDEGEIYRPGTQTADQDKIWADYVYQDLNPVDQKIMEWRTGRGGQGILGVAVIAKRLKMSPAAVSQRAKRINEILANRPGSL